MTARQIGSRYVVESLIGRGSAGQVWLGQDVDGRRWALKILRPELAEDPGVVRQFVAERAALASIRHPHVVGVHDLVVEGSTLAIVMDLVEGSDLRTVLRARGTLPPVEVARCGVQLSGALAAAHAAGIAHRDLKPENVLLDGATGEVRLTDFGVAQLMDASSITPERVAGTPQYMAPEVAEGYVNSPSGDLYSLGVLLYELCCGAPPFAGRGSALATMKAHATDVPRRPDGIPDDLWDVISDLLAKDPERRPASASAVEARLQRLVPSLTGLPAAPLARTSHAIRSRTLDDRTVWGVSRVRSERRVDPSVTPVVRSAPSDVGDDEWDDGPGRPRRVVAGVAVAGGLLAVAGMAFVLLSQGGAPTTVGESPSATRSDVTSTASPTGLAGVSRPTDVSSPAGVPGTTTPASVTEVTVMPRLYRSGQGVDAAPAPGRSSDEGRRSLPTPTPPESAAGPGTGSEPTAPVPPVGDTPGPPAGTSAPRATTPRPRTTSEASPDATEQPSAPSRSDAAPAAPEEPPIGEVGPAPSSPVASLVDDPVDAAPTEATSS